MKTAIISRNDSPPKTGLKTAQEGISPDINAVKQNNEMAQRVFKDLH